MELVIMAAGMGSRFGGLKQIEKIDDAGNFIIDYSIFDAIKAGFDKVVFIIKESFFEEFKETIGSRVKKYIDVDYVFQNDDYIPKSAQIPPERVKPWGTAHAILCAKKAVHGNFAVINADDFYGKSAFLVMADFLKNNSEKNKYALVGFKVKNTLSETGSVKRGIIETKNSKLTKITESKIEKKDGKIFAKSISTLNENKDDVHEIDENQLVSMNLLGFTPTIFDELEMQIKMFFDENKETLGTAEYLIPDVIERAVKEKRAEIKVLETNEKWLGVTYREDLDFLKSEIEKKRNSGDYPKILWK